MEHEPPRAAGAALAVGELQQRGRDPTPARAALATANRLNWTVGPTNSSRQVASTNRPRDRDQMDALAVAPIELLA